MQTSLLRFASRATLPALLLLTTACSGGGGSTTGSPAPPQNAGFSAADLGGDWTGVFQPANPLKDSFNFYLRFDANGNPLGAAEGLGHEWSVADSAMAASVTKKGSVSLRFEPVSGEFRLELMGSLDSSRTLHTGSYALWEDGELRTQGTYTAILSTGVGHFGAAQLAGVWNGYGYKRDGGRRRNIVLELGADGTVLGGDIEIHEFVVGGANTGIFQITDTAIGRLDNVVMQSTDGSTQTFSYLLVNDTGTVMSGPGTDSTMGTGVVRLAK